MVKKETIHPAKYLTGGVALPGDKSISHRYAMLAALAEGTSELRHFSAAADCHSTLGCMRALGAEVKTDKDTVRVTGRGLAGLKSSWRALDAGNSGTTIRLLSGILAGQDFKTTISGDDSLQKRPMNRGAGSNGSIKFAACNLDVPGDISSAVFFIAAASLFPESSILIQNVGLNPT